MKKLLSLVLICVMGFGMISCVESEESQSVTELRNAKAEQLKALVNLYNAQAEAARITAQAEAALKAAQAAYQQAQADYTAEQLDQLKKKFELQLESLIAEYESKIAQYNYNKANYEKMLMDKLAEIEAAEKANLIALYNKYSEYSDALNAANTNLIQNKVNLAKVEAEIVTVKEAAEAAIAEQKEVIAENEAIIAAEEAKLAIYQDHEYAGMNIDSLELEVVKANLAWRDAKTAYDKNEAKAEANTRTAAMDAVEALDKSVTDFNFRDIIKRNDRTKTSDDEWVNRAYDQQNRPVGWFGIAPYDSYYVNETNLDTWKNEVLKTDLEDGVATATENLEKAEATLKTFQGFKADFEKAEAARAALYAYDQAYANYDEVSETVESAQLRVDLMPTFIEEYEGYLKISTAQLDTLNNVDLTKFTTEDYDEWNFAFWRRSQDMINSMDAFRTALATQESKLEILENAKDALETAEEAKEALTEEATEAEVEAADLAIENAEKDVANAEKAVKAAQEAVKAAYDKVVYDAEVQYEIDKDDVDWYKKSLKDWEEKLEKAKENKAALISAYPAAKEAIATLNEIFGNESEFTKFWNENNYTYTLKNKTVDRQTFYKSNFIKDSNNDNIPDMNLNDDGTVVDGLYLVAPKSYRDFNAKDNSYYLTDGEKYVSPDYDAMVAHYTTEVAKAKDALTTANNSLAKASEWKDNWDAKEKELRDFVAAKNEEIKDVQVLQDAYFAALDAADKAEKAVTELKGKLDAVSELLTLAKGNYYVENQNIANLISACESNINNAKTAIAAAEEAIKAQEAILASDEIKWENRTQYKEALIAELKANIEKYTAEVELYTKLVEDAKAALDAAMSAADAE